MSDTVHKNLVVSIDVHLRFEDAEEDHYQRLCCCVRELLLDLEVAAQVGTHIHAIHVVTQVPLEVGVAALELVIINRWNSVLSHQCIALVQQYEFPQHITALEVRMESLVGNVLALTG